jgi:hypothetical protein
VVTVSRGTRPDRIQYWRHVLTGAVVVLGGVLIVAGSWLPWSADVNTFGPLFAVGWEGGDGGMMPMGSGLGIIIEGLVVLLAGLVVIVAGVATGRRPSLWKVTLLASIIAGVVAWAAFSDAVHRYGGFPGPPGVWLHVDEPGLGVWCILGGAVIGGVASLARLERRPPRAAE